MRLRIRGGRCWAGFGPFGIELAPLNGQRAANHEFSTAIVTGVMVAVAALYSAGLVLLVLAGVMKLRDPSSAAELLVDLGWRHQASVLAVLVRMLGAIEIGLGLVGFLADWKATAVAVSLAYVGFGAVAWQAMRRGSVSCGCFGRASSQPTAWHVAGNWVFAVGSGIAAASSSPGQVVADQSIGSGVFLVVVGLLAGSGLALFSGSRASQR